MIKKTIQGKAAEILDSISEDGFTSIEAIGILFVAIKLLIKDKQDSIDHIKGLFSKFIDKAIREDQL